MEQVLEGGIRTIVSYDVTRLKRSLRSKVYRLVFGHSTVKRLKAGAKTYTYRGFASRPGFRYIGQSVVALLPQDAMKLVSNLRGLGVDHSVTTAYLLPE